MKGIIDKIKLRIDVIKQDKLTRKLLKTEIISLIVELISLIDKLIEEHIYKECIHDRTMSMYIKEFQKCKTVSDFTKLKLDLLNSIEDQKFKLKSIGLSHKSCI